MLLKKIECLQIILYLNPVFEPKAFKRIFQLLFFVPRGGILRRGGDGKKSDFTGFFN